MRLLDAVVRVGVALSWLLLLAVVLCLYGVCWVAFPALLGPSRRRGVARPAPVQASANEQRDYGDENAPPPLYSYCLRCARRVRTPPESATGLGGCPDCGAVRWGSHPNLPIVGEPRER